MCLIHLSGAFLFNYSTCPSSTAFFSKRSGHFVKMVSASHASRFQSFQAQKEKVTRPRAHSIDSSDDTLSWYIPSEHESFKSMVENRQRDDPDDDYMEGPFRRAGLHRSFSFQGSSGLRGRYLATVKPHLYRNPEDNWEIESLSFTKLSAHQRRTISCLWAAKLSYFFALGMVPVVLPPAVEAQGLGTTATGTLFAVWGAAAVVCWPLWQMTIAKIGTKNLLLVGLFLTGISYLLFGCLHFEAEWQRFMILSYIIRVIEGAGFSALEVAITAKILVEFPRHESGAYGSTQNCVGIGLTIGSCLGGFLYSVADIAASFITCGLLLFFVGFITICLLEKRPYIYSSLGSSAKSKRKFLRQWSVWATIIMLFFQMFTVGCLATILEPHLRQNFKLHFTIEGIILAVISLSYAFGAALWQWLITHNFVYGLDSVNIAGLLITALTLILLGPCKAFSIPTDLLWLNVVCFLAIGGAISMVCTASTNTLLEEAESRKMNKLAAYSTITSIVVVTQCLGVAVGAPIGGYLNQFLDFQLSTSIVSAILFGISTIAVVYCLIKCILRVQNYRKLATASRADISKSGRSNRAPIVGASLAVSSRNPKILDRNNSKLSRASRFDDLRPLLSGPGGKCRTYGTYL